MRPKFRAWDKRYNTMSEVTSIDFSKRIVEVIRRENYDTWHEAVLLKQIKLLQSTGVTDHNGIEIFEGDILINENSDIGQVVFEDGAYYVVHEDYTKNCFLFIATNFNPEIKIIGNIYEHPHLLEEDTK